MTKKIKILFDATIILNDLNSDTSRSGIFFASYNIFLELCKRSDIELTLFCNPQKIFELERYLKEKRNITNVKVINVYNETIKLTMVNNTIKIWKRIILTFHQLNSSKLVTRIKSKRMIYKILMYFKKIYKINNQSTV